MDTEKFVITGRGANAEQFIGRTEAEHFALFAAVDSGDVTALETVIGAAQGPQRLNVDAIYAKANAARAPRSSQAPRSPAPRASAPAATFDPDAIYRRVNAAKAPRSGGRGR